MVKQGDGDDRLARWKRWMREQYCDSSNLHARAALHERFGTEKGSWFLREGWRILLTDLSPGMMTEARGLLRESAQFSHAVADVQALPLADASVDAVIANQMLSHVPDPSAAVRELRRVALVHRVPQ